MGGSDGSVASKRHDSSEALGLAEFARAWTGCTFPEVSRSLFRPTVGASLRPLRGTDEILGNCTPQAPAIIEGVWRATYQDWFSICYTSADVCCSMTGHEGKLWPATRLAVSCAKGWLRLTHEMKVWSCDPHALVRGVHKSEFTRTTKHAAILSIKPLRRVLQQLGCKDRNECA